MVRSAIRDAGDPGSNPALGRGKQWSRDYPIDDLATTTLPMLTFATKARKWTAVMRGHDNHRVKFRISVSCHRGDDRRASLSCLSYPNLIHMSSFFSNQFSTVIKSLDLVQSLRHMTSLLRAGSRA